MTTDDVRQGAFEMLRGTLSAEDGAGSDLAVFRLEEDGEWAEVQGFLDMGHLVSEVVSWASEQAEAIDRMGPAARCHLCVGAGGYEDHDGQWVECSCQRPDREPSDVEVRAAAESILYENQPNSTRYAVDWPVSTADAVEIARAALIAAQEARNHE